jgi:hypothetical protein
MMHMRTTAACLAALLTAGLSGCTEHKTPVQQILNTGASIPASTLPMNPMSWRVVTSFVNRNEHTMATLYGNDAAIESARSGGTYHYGAVLSLVTWQQKEDPHWFGGSIPAAPLRVEFAQASGGPSPLRWNYSRYEGKPLHAVDTPADNQAQRVNFLISQHAAMMP